MTETEIKYDELVTSIKTLKNRKAAGPREIRNHLISYGSEELFERAQNERNKRTEDHIISIFKIGDRRIGQESLA